MTFLRIHRTSSRTLLARILDDPSLVAAVQHLSPRALGKLIDHVGLEDCGEIIALATTEQIEQIFDDDLWRSARPGIDEAFDADRFALWLDVMLEAGEDFAVRKLIELPEDLVTLALHRCVLVLDIDQLRAAMEEREGAERIDKALEGCLSEEFDAYQVIARRHDRWDSIVTILASLDRHDHALLDRVLERCCAMSSEYIDDNGGLYDVLTSDEMAESDLAADREDRRAEDGFIAPSQAASFLALCRSMRPEDVLAGPRDAVTRAYFRELALMKGPDRMAPLRASSGAVSSAPADLEHMLAELDVDDRLRDARPVFLLEGKTEAAGATPALLKSALAVLHDRDPPFHARRIEELAYLTNVMVSGYAVHGRRLRPYEAVLAVAAVCNRGLEHLARDAKGTTAERAVALLGREGADKAFRVGWWCLHHEDLNPPP